MKRNSSPCLILQLTECIAGAHDSCDFNHWGNGHRANNHCCHTGCNDSTCSEVLFSLCLHRRTVFEVNNRTYAKRALLTELSRIIETSVLNPSITGIPTGGKPTMARVTPKVTIKRTIAIMLKRREKFAVFMIVKFLELFIMLIIAFYSNREIIYSIYISK